MSDATARDIELMREAIALAAEADMPFGAVIVKDGKTLARGRNSGKRLRDPTAHGEMVAIHQCLADHGPEVLRGSTIYTSGEPCPMCMGACGLCRVDPTAQHQDRSDYGSLRRDRRKDTVHDGRDHRRRARRGSAPVV
jgi:tRNA(Arg) A34 adenosine deaminase TadA